MNYIAAKTAEEKYHRLFIVHHLLELSYQGSSLNRIDDDFD